MARANAGVNGLKKDQRFEYCGRFRALWRPYFLRSTARGSRVTNPAFFNGNRYS